MGSRKRESPNDQRPKGLSMGRCLECVELRDPSERSLKLNVLSSKSLSGHRTVDRHNASISNVVATLE